MGIGLHHRRHPRDDREGVRRGRPPRPAAGPPARLPRRREQAADHRDQRPREGPRPEGSDPDRLHPRQRLHTQGRRRAAPRRPRRHRAVGRRPAPPRPARPRESSRRHPEIRRREDPREPPHPPPRPGRHGRLHKVLQEPVPRRASPSPLRPRYHREPPPHRMTGIPENDTPIRKTHPSLRRLAGGDPMNALDLARWQFGITTIYHFLFIPLSIGLSLLIAIMQPRSSVPAFPSTWP